MLFKPPKESLELTWTAHAKDKMRFYGLSESKLKKVLRRPDRKELGVAPKTIALMQKTGSKGRPTEIWLMYQEVKKKNLKKKKIISAWRYPGTSPLGKVRIPDEVLKDLDISL